MITNLVCFFQEHWPNIKEFANSVFVTSIAGAGFGAFAGAYIAQKIAEENKSKDELLKEIRNTKAALTVASAICEAFIALMDQHVKDLKGNFDEVKKQFKEFQVQRKNGQISKDAIFPFGADFRRLSLLPIPMSVLQQQMFEKLTVKPRPLRLQIALAQSAHGLNDFVGRRNQLIDGYAVKNLSSKQIVEVYFGEPDQSGTVNEEYESCLTAIHTHTNNGIYFSLSLCEELELHGKQLAENYARLFKERAPSIGSVDFSRARELGLIPDPALYSGWVTGFVEEPIPKSGKRILLEMLGAKLKKLAYWGRSAR